MNPVLELAADVRAGRASAGAVVEACLARLAADDLAAVTRTLPERARTEAARIDAMVAAGTDPGPLCGVPYGVKDLFDIAGLATTAGSVIYADEPPATRDAEAIRRLQAAGAVLVATLNMDEFAYGFATINARHGTTRNPHDRARLAGGSSGGSAAAVAAGMLPFTLGSDTNGSIRVPASLTGIYGLKPTHDGLPMGGVFPFAASFDDIGPFTLSVPDMQCVWSVLSGDQSGSEGTAAGQHGRVARLGGRFRENAHPDQLAAIDAIAPNGPEIDIAGIAQARSAAFLITAFEGGALHRDKLRQRAMDFDPATRDRLLAGGLVPEELYGEALDVRARFREAVLAQTAGYDVLLAPAAPCEAPPIADPRIWIDGELRPARADLGIHTQPVSFLGLPSLAVPLARPGNLPGGQLPLGIQLIGRPGGEPALFAFATKLAESGIAGVTMPSPQQLEETR